MLFFFAERRGTEEEKGYCFEYQRVQGMNGASEAKDVSSWPGRIRRCAFLSCFE